MIALDFVRGGFAFTVSKIADRHLQSVWDRIALEYGNGSTLDMERGAAIFAKHIASARAAAR